jgi:hypothetical protein
MHKADIGWQHTWSEFYFMIVCLTKFLNERSIFCDQSESLTGSFTIATPRVRLVQTVFLAPFEK